MFHVKHFDVVVIGGGHAGCEAALAAARMGRSTLLITMDPTKIGEMSCNPSVGGVGKGQLVKELDALGGEMGVNADLTGIQFKRLNTRKGSAVQSTRCQSDKWAYARRIQKVLRSQPGLEVFTGEVKRLETEAGRISGVEIAVGERRETIRTRAAVITSGTFMRGWIHCGEMQTEGGRFGEKGAYGLSDHLRELGFTILRLKTGTPPRLKRSTIDFSKMNEQGGDIPPYTFSFSATAVALPQVPCFLANTNAATHDVIQQNLSRSPLYSGQIKGIGPRYCPSIEDKVVKFPTKTSHPLFFEPESLETDWIYPNGISTSLPPDVQTAFLRTVPGCESVEFYRYGYAVEYDCIDPRQLHPTLHSRELPGLFFAGQVNGTSGYEEAAAQGLVAGINAALWVVGEGAWTPRRTDSYIGVMVDDLTSLGVTEPYRMFTSRAEYRLSLREDNADQRLRPIGHRLGLVSDAEYARFERKLESIEKTKRVLEQTWIKPAPEIDARLRDLGSAAMSYPQPLLHLLRRPDVSYSDLLPWMPETGIEDAWRETLEVEVKYDGYIRIQREEIARLEKMRDLSIPDGIDFTQVTGLSRELRDKLGAAQPKSLAEASAISGVTPAALTALLFHIQQEGKKRVSAPRPASP